MLRLRATPWLLLLLAVCAACGCSYAELDAYAALPAATDPGDGVGMLA